MLDAVREFFRRRIEAEASAPGEAGEHALRLAAGALLFEIVRADGEVSPQERTVMQAAVQSTFGLEPAETRELMDLAEEASRGAASLFEFTQVVDAAFSPEQKKRTVELLWLVAFADGRKDAHEEHLVRRIASLLHVPHPDFIDAKIRARSRT
ncbi:MAG TPA: TerB family tellurite resistance protein [Vicinamibacteria bacterium]|nr:TerB family tellurite resistance protein [Vicinamibacteria bacterium]